VLLAEIYATGHSEDGEFIPVTQKRLSKRFSKGIEHWWHAWNIVRLARGRRRLLEIGYGEGHLLKALNATGRFELEGIDYATAPVSHMRARGLDVFTGSLADRRYRDGRWDFVVGFHVLEHVQHLDAFMSEVRRVLAERGRVYFVLQCVMHVSAVRAGPQWKLFGPPGHLWHFSVRAMKRFMADRGFRVIFAHCISNRPHLTDKLQADETARLIALDDQLVAAETWIYERARQALTAYYAAGGVKHHRHSNNLIEDVGIEAKVTCVLRAGHP
jgi:SAM-dependent methyltransferase